MSCGDNLQKCLVSVRLRNAELLMAPQWGSPLSDKTIPVGKHFASLWTNTHVVRHGECGLSNVTEIPLGARRMQLSGARDGRNIRCSGGPVRRRKLHAVRCVSGSAWDKAMITHNETSRARADTNAVQGETRDRALVTTVRGRHPSDKRHYG